MTKTLATLSLAVALVLGAACGPSAAELRTAHDTSYTAPPATLFAATREAVESTNNKIHATNDGDLKLETEGVWYTPEGQIDTTVGNNIARLQEDSINIAYAVQLTKTGGDAYKVDVTPVIGRKHGLSSSPDKMDPADPSLPGWVAGKTDALVVHIHDKLKPYATTGAPTAAPASATPASAPAPTAPATPTTPASPAPASPPAS